MSGVETPGGGVSALDAPGVVEEPPHPVGLPLTVEQAQRRALVLDAAERFAARRMRRHGPLIRWTRGLR